MGPEHARATWERTLSIVRIRDRAILLRQLSVLMLPTSITAAGRSRFM
jgi:hypothetical protein